MTTDYRALCAELLGIFEKYDDESNLGGIIWDMKMDGNDLLERARAALAAEPPKPVARLLHATDKHSCSVASPVARTYTELSTIGGNPYWDEGEPLYTAPPAIAVEPQEQTFTPEEVEGADG